MALRDYVPVDNSRVIMTEEQQKAWVLEVFKAYNDGKSPEEVKKERAEKERAKRKLNPIYEARP